MKKVFVTRPIEKSGIALLKKAGYRVTVRTKTSAPTRGELLKAMKSYDALLCLLTERIDASLLAHAGPQLKVISNYAVGFDNIDVATADKKGIIIANTPCAEVSDAVADHTIALIFALERKIVAADRFMRSGKYRIWTPTIFVGEGLSGKTIGLIGLGRIGKSVAVRLREGFKVNVLYHDVVRDSEFEKEYGALFVSNSELLNKSDIVSIHVPLLASTRHLINTAMLNKMKRGTLLVNTARGAIVDQHAIRAAIERGRLGGYATDVYECEPALACEKSDRAWYRNSEYIICTPHIASATLAARQAMARIAAQNIIDVFNGKQPEHKVTVK